ncbi:IclR family transcriptional regulator [Neobacillus rhizophilus]|uniref:IclR family transcriptional regulator n=1 Tax=Neobacillus rhizophilus TaxID=2833579 RepID=A0A942UC37_9BACI|nr:IclR family transcriptional regulator [Neobacillus rhizophilus]MBS4216712.1 IclR family transcriptional regulator [Neobacillus rhizophilus]MBU8920205.1 IclR family transcriptional regulator [Bacillus sp. FJAT-29953]
MKEKYWVPSIEKAHNVLKEIAENPNQLRLIDLSNRLNINKSSLFSLLNTLEILKWITKEHGDTYSLGPAAGAIGSAYFNQFNILQSFYKEASYSVAKINEHIQLGILEGGEVIYLGKAEGDSRVRLITDPGMRFPAYASAIGKIQLTQFTKDELKIIYPVSPFEKKTPFTISDVDELYKNIELAKRNGYSIENQEAALGFHCVGAPIYNFENKIIAGVSFTMMTNSWEQKKESARDEIIQLAYRLSQLAGYTGDLKRA